MADLFRRKNQMFRQEALERLSSPERLDQLMQVVRPKNWLVLTTFVALVAVTLLWSIVGKLPTLVVGRGVLIRPRKVVALQVPASGRMNTLNVGVGDVVQQGDLLGTLEQAETRQELKEEQAKLQALMEQDRTKRDLQIQQSELQMAQNELERTTIELQRDDLRKRLRDAKGKIPLLKQKIDSYKQLEAAKLLPENSNERLQAEQNYLENQDNIAELMARLQQLAGQLKELEGQTRSITLQNLEASTTRGNLIRELQSNIAVLELQLNESSRIISPYDGRILELTVNVGQLVESGRRLGSISMGDASGSLSGITYFPIRSGKKIQQGMLIQIAPDTVERERFGSILGIVRSVSAFPVTREGVASLVGNPELVEELMTLGPLIQVLAEPHRNVTTFSGYQWSSSNGPEQLITTGTTMTGRVAIEYRAPITYLMPFLREISGIY